MGSLPGPPLPLNSLKHMDKLKWLIWSIEHNAWWGPNACGYTPSQTEAGRYTYEEALGIVASANMYRLCVKRNVSPNEAMVPVVAPESPVNTSEPDDQPII